MTSQAGSSSRETTYISIAAKASTNAASFLVLFERDDVDGMLIVLNAESCQTVCVQMDVA